MYLCFLWKLVHRIKKKGEGCKLPRPKSKFINTVSHCSVCLSVCLSLSLTHTHTHTPRYTAHTLKSPLKVWNLWTTISTCPCCFRQCLNWLYNYSRFMSISTVQLSPCPWQQAVKLKMANGELPILTIFVMTCTFDLSERSVLSNFYNISYQHWYIVCVCVSVLLHACT